MVEDFQEEPTRRGVLRGTAAGGLLGMGESFNRGFSLEDDDDEYAFIDDFEDGSTDNQPVWKPYLDEGNFSASVVRQPALPSGSRALRVVETKSGATSGIIGWKDGLTGWDDEWKLSGKFYTEEVPLNSSYQTHNIKIGLDEQNNLGRLTTFVGFRDGGGNSEAFGIGGDFISETRKTESVEWAEDTLYNYEISHDGDGVYTARIWTSDQSRPNSPSAKSIGDPLPAGELSAGIGVNGAFDKPIHIDHGVMRFERPDADSGPAEPPVDDTPELDALLGQKQQLIGQIRSNTGEIEAVSTTVDRRPESFVEGIEAETDEFSQQDRLQYTEGLERLISTEQITKAASSGPVSDIVSRAGNAIVNAIVTAGVEFVTAGVGKAAIDERAVKLVGEQVASSKKSVLNTFAGKFGAASTEFDNIVSRRSTDFGEAVSEYVEETPRKFRTNNGLSEDQTEVFINSLKEESIKGIVNLSKNYGEAAPDQLVSELETEVEDLKEQINRFMFRYYWFGGATADYDLDFSAPTLSEDVTFSVDLSWLGVPVLGSEFEISLPVGGTENERVQDQVAAYQKRAEELTQYAELLEPSVQRSGIESTLTESVSMIDEQASDGELETQDPADRSEIVGKTRKAIDELTEAGNTLFNIIGTLLDGVLILSIVIGLALLVIYAIILVASILSIGGAATVPVQTGVLFTLLGVLGAIDLILVTSRVATIGALLSSIAQIHNIGATFITNDRFEEVI